VVTALETAVRAAIGGVADPEMPAVSVADLGMVVDVRVLEASGRDGARVEVDLVATFSGCPATAMIRSDVTAAVLGVEGVAEGDVRFVRHVVWTPARISERAHDKLRAFGIAPPGATALPVVGVEVGVVTCPLCGSSDTVTDSPFGPTPCRSTHYCRDCQNPFEAIKH
jgi:ring-1,2-phenylacetyl-CoA epoxidase subunit PaaD